MLHYLQNLFQALDVSSLTDAVLRVAAVFLCLTVHETCHGLAALALGILIYLVYRKFYTGVVYSRSFAGCP